MTITGHRILGILGVFAAVGLLAAPACDDDEPDAATAAKVTPTKAVDRTPQPPVGAPTPAEKKPVAVAEVGDGKVGVAECDEYIDKYRKCIDDKLPESTRGYMTDAIDQSLLAWKEAAAGPNKDGVAATCKTALDAAKQATSAMGCAW